MPVVIRFEAVHIVERTRLFINIPDVDSSYSDSTRLDTLKPAVKITVQVPDSLHSGFVYLAGTVGCISKVEGKTVVIDSVAQRFTIHRFVLPEMILTRRFEF